MTDYAKDLTAELRISLLTQLQRAGALLGTKVPEGSTLYEAAMMLEGLGADSPLPTREFLEATAAAVSKYDRLGDLFSLVFSRLADIPRVMGKTIGNKRFYRDHDRYEDYVLSVNDRLLGVKKRLEQATDALEMISDGPVPSSRTPDELEVALREGYHLRMKALGRAILAVFSDSFYMEVADRLMLGSLEKGGPKGSELREWATEMAKISEKDVAASAALSKALWELSWVLHDLETLEIPEEDSMTSHLECPRREPWKLRPTTQEERQEMARVRLDMVDSLLAA